VITRKNAEIAYTLRKILKTVEIDARLWEARKHSKIQVELNAVLPKCFPKVMYATQDKSSCAVHKTGGVRVHSTEERSH
jgi:hypothetical protein